MAATKRGTKRRKTTLKTSHKPGIGRKTTANRKTKTKRSTSATSTPATA